MPAGSWSWNPTSTILRYRSCSRTPIAASVISGILSPVALQVVIRVRPPLPREVEGERMFQNIVSVDKEEHVITISENLNAVLDEVRRWVL